MVLFDKIRDFIYGLEERNFYIYSAAFLGTIVLLSAGMIYYQYSSTEELVNSITEINDSRKDTVRALLNKGQRVKRKLADINKMLAQDPDFKIGEYFKSLDTPMRPVKAVTPIQTERDDNYRETSLKADFNEVTMEKLVKLLKTIEQTNRIYIKELIIKKSVKTPQTIDAELTIATLLPKIAETD